MWKLLKFVKFFTKNYQNRINSLDLTGHQSHKMVSRDKKSCLKSLKNGKNIIFQEKCLMVTDIFFGFYGGLPFNFWPKKWRKYFFLNYSGWKLCYPGYENATYGGLKKLKYPFWTKTFNDNVFQFIDCNNFCINTFWIGPIH